MWRKVPKRNHKASSNEESCFKGIKVRGVDEHHQRRLLPPTVEKPKLLIAFKILGMTIQSHLKSILFSNTNFFYVSQELLEFVFGINRWIRDRGYLNILELDHYVLQPQLREH